eukprot:TRINITY_DN12140_c0_g1_i1.p1 TRINITY_DN12140_c0_g1~~TRINITY_DN12140_c0_g1_i1.p1  ORF type:complete len:177 (+),score=39.36 TRINITY_DN12140_c0_g1_i1:43-573(+)
MCIRDRFDKTLPMYDNYAHIFNKNKQRIVACLECAGFVDAGNERKVLDWYKKEIARAREDEAVRAFVSVHNDSGDIQLLLPLSVGDKLAMVAVLNRQKNVRGAESYLISTILDPIMAYNDARICGRVENEALIEAMSSYRDMKAEENLALQERSDDDTDFDGDYDCLLYTSDAADE